MDVAVEEKTPVTETRVVDSSLKHLELWVELLWHFRAPDADWAIADPQFCPAILGDGIIILYDSMTPRKRNKDASIVENRKVVRLTHKLPLVFGDPIQVAIAYRERMLANVLKIKRRLVFESTPNVENEGVEIETVGSAQTSALRMRQGGVSMRGAYVRKIGGTKDVTCESRSSSSNRLRTINGKIVRMRGKGDGSRAYMYPGGRKPIGFGILAPAWPLGITPEDYRIHAERPKPVVLQEELVLKEHYQRRMIA
ncbi:hypothetical protein Tco_0060776 [Tanacetum coccineum]